MVLGGVEEVSPFQLGLELETLYQAGNLLQVVVGMPEAGGGERQRLWKSNTSSTCGEEHHVCGTMPELVIFLKAKC